MMALQKKSDGQKACRRHAHGP